MCNLSWTPHSNLEKDNSLSLRDDALVCSMIVHCISKLYVTEGGDRDNEMASHERLLLVPVDTPPRGRDEQRDAPE